MISISEKQLSRSFRVLPAVALAAAMMALVLMAIVASISPGVYAQETKTADFIVQFDQSDVSIRSIQFSETISGLVALEQSGFDIVTDDGLVCSIEGVGCPVEDCFCKCQSDPCFEWGYSKWNGESWQISPIGLGGSVISQTGSIEGLRWGERVSLAPPIVTAMPDQVKAAQKALTWLRSTQVVTDGGWGSMGSSVEAAFAIGANKEKAVDWQAADGAPTLQGYVIANAVGFADNNSAASGKTTVASAATDICWPAGALNPSDYYSPTLGAYSEHMGFHIWGLLGALANGDSVSAESVTTIKDGPLANGGWEWMAGFGADTNTTSVAVQALVATGESVTSSEVISGLAFLKSAQNEDGGFTYDPNSSFGTDSDTNSTSYVVQALWASGEDPTGPAWTTGGKTPIDYLLDMQLTDGSFEWMPDTGTDQLATQQAIPALLGNAYPLAAGIDACSTAYLPHVSAE